MRTRNRWVLVSLAAASLWGCSESKSPGGGAQGLSYPIDRQPVTVPDVPLERVSQAPQPGDVDFSRINPVIQAIVQSVVRGDDLIERYEARFDEDYSSISQEQLKWDVEIAMKDVKWAPGTTARSHATSSFKVDRSDPRSLGIRATIDLQLETDMIALLRFAGREALKERLSSSQQKFHQRIRAQETRLAQLRSIDELAPLLDDAYVLSLEMLQDETAQRKAYLAKVESGEIRCGASTTPSLPPVPGNPGGGQGGGMNPPALPVNPGNGQGGMNPPTVDPVPPMGGTTPPPGGTLEPGQPPVNPGEPTTPPAPGAPVVTLPGNPPTPPAPPTDGPTQPGTNPIPGLPTIPGTPGQPQPPTDPQQACIDSARRRVEDAERAYNGTREARITHLNAGTPSAQVIVSHADLTRVVEKDRSADRVLPKEFRIDVGYRSARAKIAGFAPRSEAKLAELKQKLREDLLPIQNEDADKKAKLEKDFRKALQDFKKELRSAPETAPAANGNRPN